MVTEAGITVLASFVKHDAGRIQDDADGLNKRGKGHDVDDHDDDQDVVGEDDVANHVTMFRPKY